MFIHKFIKIKYGLNCFNKIFLLKYLFESFFNNKFFLLFFIADIIFKVKSCSVLFSMLLRIYKPVTSSKRHCISIYCYFISKKPVLKFKLKKHMKISGRNNSGKITIFNRGGSQKQKYRVLSKNNSSYSEAIVYNLEYNPIHNAFLIAVYEYKIKKFFYLLAPNNIKIGDLLKFGSKAQNKLGHFMFLKNVPLGCPIFNIQNRFTKSAGTFSVLLHKTKYYAQLILSSGKKRNINLNKLCCLGAVSNSFFYYKNLGKAGKSRWLGKKPKVKGICMNPVDHPNGGGEGKSSSKRKSPWGKVIKSPNIKISS